MEPYDEFSRLSLLPAVICPSLGLDIIRLFCITVAAMLAAPLRRSLQGARGLSTTAANNMDWKKKSAYKWFLPIQTRVKVKHKPSILSHVPIYDNII